MKQGDVISPVLFNAGLEHAIRVWKAHLLDHGINIVSTANLTNVRFADDLMLYAMEADLASVGLSLNAAKFFLTRLFTTTISPEVAYIDFGGEMMQVLSDGETHMYFGGESRTGLAHRISAAWGKFHRFRFILVNKHLSIKGRLKLFNAMVTPTALFGLSTLALTARQLEQLDHHFIFFTKPYNIKGAPSKPQIIRSYILFVRTYCRCADGAAAPPATAAPSRSGHTHRSGGKKVREKNCFVTS